MGASIRAVGMPPWQKEAAAAAAAASRVHSGEPTPTIQKSGGLVGRGLVPRGSWRVKVGFLRSLESGLVGGGAGGVGGEESRVRIEEDPLLLRSVFPIRNQVCLSLTRGANPIASTRIPTVQSGSYALAEPS